MKHPVTLSNRYQLQVELGAGGMGTVYRAYDRLSQETVAVKRLNMPANLLSMFSTDGSADMMLSLAHEFETLAGLRHPNIISVLDYGFDEDKNPYLVEEYLAPARALTHYARQQPVDQVIDLLMQLLQALAYLHRRGILHRDIKPENVLVVEGRVKVLDFGLAAARGTAPESVGTLGYMAPEVLQHQHYSEASDLYAAGVMMYEAFAGSLPFRDNSLDRMVEKIMQQPVDSEQLDIVPPIQQVIGQLLAKDPAGRPASALAAMRLLATASGAPLVEDAAVRESFLQAATFVGRDEEMARLQEALAVAPRGRGSLWLVGGESGVGKSRLLDEVRTRALTGGFLVVRGQGVAEGGLPYQLWRNVVRRLLLHTEVSELEAGILQEIVPDIESLLERPVPPAPELAEAAAQRRLVNTIVGLLRRQTEPLLLLLEDLQWADESLGPLEDLGRFVGDLPLVVIGSYRNDERPDLPNDLPAMQLLPLERLNRQEIENLSAAMLGEAGQQRHVVQLLQTETEGNAFFVVEVVRALAEESGSLQDVGQVTLAPGLLVGGIQRVIQRRLGKVAPDDMPLLRLAAIAGRRPDLAVLRALDPVMALEGWLARLGSVAVLTPIEGEWTFTHDKLREALLASLPIHERPALYGRVAEAIQTAHPADPAYAPILAQLWHEAGNAQQEAHYAVLAGQQAVKANRIREARALYRRVLALLPSVDVEVSAAELWLRLAECEVRLSNYDTSRDHFQQALALAQEATEERTLAMIHRGLARLAFELSDFDGARQHIEEGLRYARRLGDNVLTGILTAIRGPVELRTANDNEAFLQLQTARALLEAEADTKSHLISVYLHLGIIHAERRQYPEAKEAYHRCLAASEEIGEHQFMPHVSNSLGVVALRERDYEAAEKHYAAGLGFSRNSGNRFLEALIGGNLGEVALTRQDFAQALRYYTEGMQVARQIENPYMTAVNQSGRGLVLMFEGQLAAARAAMEAALAVFRELDERYMMGEVLSDLAMLALREEPPRPPGDLLNEVLALAQAAVSPALLLKMFTVYAQWHRQQGREEQAGRLAGYLEQQRGTLDPYVAELYLAPLLADLRRAMPAEALSATLAAGAALTDEEVLAEVTRFA